MADCGKERHLPLLLRESEPQINVSESLGKAVTSLGPVAGYGSLPSRVEPGDPCHCTFLSQPQSIASRNSSRFVKVKEIAVNLINLRFMWDLQKYPYETVKG